MSSLSEKLKQKKQDQQKESPYWKPNEGDILEGIAGEIEETITVNGEAEVMDITTESGQVYSVFVNSILKKELKEEKVKPGDKIAIEYVGLIKSNKNPKRNFKKYVVVKDDETA